MPKPSAAYRDSSDLPRPPPSYEPGPAASSSSEPLLGEDRGRHSEDDIPDDFKYIVSFAPSDIRYGVSVSQSDISIRMGMSVKWLG